MTDGRAASHEEENIRQLEERLRLFVENVRDYAIFLTDAAGTIVSWNAGVGRLLGYSEAEFLGQPISLIFLPEDVSSGAADREIQLAVQLGRSEDERWHRRKDGSRFWASGVLTALRDDDGRLRGFAKIMRDITERKLAEEERKQLLQREQQARQEAEAAARVRDQFLATVSHELRTPLNAIVGWARILEEQQLEPDRVRHALETISRNAQLQSKLIEDLLDVSRILAGKLTVEQRPIDLLPIVQASIDSFSPEARAKRIDIECRLHPLDIDVRGDARRLQQVLWNLLSNAIKFTPQGGRVSIEMRQDDRKAIIQVTDTGIGIRPEFLPHVFEPFRQWDMSVQRAHGGIGLGLAIVRHLVEQHGGLVYVDSAGEGKGSTFTVELPLSTIRATPTAGGTLPTDYKPSLQGLTVLLIEDEADSREVLMTALQLSGAQVVAAATVREGLDLVSLRRPDVVLCDIGLPGESGLGFIQQLRALPSHSGGQLPAAALSAYTRPEDRLRALQAGFQIHLAKPIEPTELVAAVCTLAGRSNK